ncbi:heterokaryon incompatibility protein-domain-containing protein [Cadophora sp. MPI-SDFR-AT-0126]|nr:heterokaryon incompatibility protein-domain-containing protein [Leotiomycetes sp. MPI-SDFR-AT-0126]
MFKKAKQFALSRRASTTKQTNSGGLSTPYLPTVTPDAVSPGIRDQVQYSSAYHESEPTRDGLPTITVDSEDVDGLQDRGETTLCVTCGPLTTCTEQPVSTIDIFRSADGHCSICLLFSSVCLLADNNVSVGYLSSWSGIKGGFGVYLITKIIEGGLQRPGITVAVVVLAVDGERSPSPFPWLPNVTKSPFTRSQVRDTQMLSAWIGECQANHPSCRQDMLPKLPTRIIDVGSNTVQPSLKITNGEVGRYLALSHRWGTLNSQVKMLVTKRGSIEDFCREISLDLFPLTFRHAIEVSRSLGIQYIWIDSLCIIQDDYQDWEIEAARMGDIYENAYATLFAERAAHCDEGLFQNEEDKSITNDFIREIKYQDPQTGDNYWILASTRHTYYPNSLAPEEAFCLVDKAVSQLQNRGWIMQEEILSRRKICFSSTELHWQCASISRCECGLQSLTEARFTDNDLTRNLLMTQRSDGNVTRGLSASNSSRRLAGRTTDLNKSWKKLVEMYGHRTFTYERDRLSALAGVASKLGRPPENYWAGIWRENANSQLLWRGWNRPDALCARHETYCAPTWSWASLQGGIVFCSFGTDSRQYPATQIWKVMDGSCKPSGENPLGPVSMGTVRVQSKVVEVFVDECKGPAPKIDTYAAMQSHERRGIHERTREGKTYHLIVRPTQAGNTSMLEAGPSVISLDTVDDWEMFAGKTEQRFLYLIAQVGSATGAAMTDYTLRTMGLLIRESASHPGCWERVCMVAPRGWWGDWQVLAEDRELVLR